MGSKRSVALILTGLFLYLLLFTWNSRTGHLDAFSSYTGLDLSGWIIRPGQWVVEESTDMWERYVYLVGVREENEQLRRENEQIKLENMFFSERANAVGRLEKLLGFVAPPGWSHSGARVVAGRMSPAAGHGTIVVDKGAVAGVLPDEPVISLNGVVGRVLRTGMTGAHVLLLTDPGSRIAVVGQKHRSQGICFGQGTDKPVSIRYMKLNSEIEPGELLVTSGLSGIYPKGIPVARVTGVERSDISLFLSITAEPLVDISTLEEVLVLSSQSGVKPGEDE